MIKVFTLEDHEDASTIVVSLDDDYTGALVYCINQDGERVYLTVDSKLLKYLCKQVAKALKVRAQKANSCGLVNEESL